MACMLLNALCLWCGVDSGAHQMSMPFIFANGEVHSAYVSLACCEKGAIGIEVKRYSVAG
jgi:hypothetical protein